MLSLVKKKRKKLFCLVASMGQRKNYKTPCYCVSITVSNGSHGHHSLSDCKPWLIKIYLNSFVSNHYLCLGVTDLWSWLKLLKIFCINSCFKVNFKEIKHVPVQDFLRTGNNPNQVVLQQLQCFCNDWTGFHHMWRLCHTSYPGH